MAGQISTRNGEQVRRSIRELGNANEPEGIDRKYIIRRERLYKTTITNPRLLDAKATKMTGLEVTDLARP